MNHIIEDTQMNDMLAILTAGMMPQVPPHGGGSIPYVVVPQGYAVKDLESMLPIPTRIRANVVVTDSNSFITYCTRHKNEASSVYALIDQENKTLTVQAILDDNAAQYPSWRSHVCLFKPALSVEWCRWSNSNGKAMSQGDFAAYLEDNLADVANVDGMPTGAQMLELALKFEATSDKRIKSRINLQSGGTRFEYVDDEDKDTRISMEVFNRFTLGLPVFDGSSSAYLVEARLKYRERDGKVNFWYELIRPDKVFKAAVTEELGAIRAGTGMPVLHGNPFA